MRLNRNPDTLVLQTLPNGEAAWLKPETVCDAEPDDALYWPTEKGRRYLAIDQLLRRGPSVADGMRGNA